MNAKERREQLIATANSLSKELRSIVEPINKVIAALVAEADSLTVKMLEGDQPKIKTRSLTLEATPEEAEIFTKRTRTCSLCGKKGHDARTCTSPKPKKKAG